MKKYSFFLGGLAVMFLLIVLVTFNSIYPYSEYQNSNKKIEQNENCIDSIKLNLIDD